MDADLAAARPIRNAAAAAAWMLIAAVALTGCAATESPAATGGATVEPTSVPTLAPSATPQPLDESLLDRRVTVLVLGKDWNEGREQNGDPSNTDAIMVISVSASYDEVALLSVPRDTVDIPMPDGTTWTGKVNAITRELGYDEMVGAIETLLDIEIDHYAEIDMDDFVTLVDAVDGVDVSPEEAITDSRLDFSLEPGDHHLDGADALSYVRTRQDGDHARSARQQEVVLGVMESLVDPDSELDVIELARGFASLETDVGLESLPTFVEIARRATEADAQVTRQVLAPPEFALFEGEEGPERGWVMIPNVDAMRAYAAEVISD